MRRFAFIVAVGLLATSAFSADDPSLSPPVACSSGVPGGISCIVSKKDRKVAHEAYARGIKLQEQHRLDEAFAQFDQASHTVPQDLQFLLARETLKGQLVFNHIERGNALLLTNAKPQAIAEFRAALDLDPDNQYAGERYQEAMRPAPALPRPLPSALSDATEIHLMPSKERADFHFRGDVRGLFTEIASAFGLSVQFDDSVQNRQVRFFVDNVDAFTALKLACELTESMWSAFDEHQFLLAKESAENHRQFDRMLLQTFVLPPHTSTQEVNDYILAMRNMFDLKFITSDLNADSVTVRAPHPVIAACARLMAQLQNPRPQVLLNVRVLEISHSITRNIGLHTPDTFNLFNIPAAALAGLGGQNIQQLINQLISNGGINQAGGTNLSSLLSQLTGGQNSIFSQPLATFGGGLTFEGLSLDKLVATLAVNESWGRTLQEVNLRAGQGADATLHVGERYPIQNASYAPIFNSPQISQIIGNNSYVPPFPSVSYEDIGLNFKAKPYIHEDGVVSLQLDLEIRSLTGASSNGVPVISNKEIKAAITVSDGEPAFVTGQVSRSDTLSMSGIPGFGYFPGLNQITASNSKQEDDDELVIVITPHVVSNFVRSTDPIWISTR